MFTFNCSILIRSAIVCEDSDQLISLIEREEGVDVRNWTVPAENPLDLEIFNSALDIFDANLNLGDVENVESTSQKESSSSWYTKSATELPETIKTTAAETTTEASYWSDWFGTAEDAEKTTRKPTTTTTTSGWYIKSGASAETTKTTTIATKIPTATTTEEPSDWSDWYFGK